MLRPVDQMTDAELEEEFSNLPWPLDGIVTFDDEPTIERSNDLRHEQENRTRVRALKAKGLWADDFWWPQA